MRILFGVHDERFAGYFADVAALLPAAECKGIASTWTAARALRKRGVKTACTPWTTAGARAPAAVPRLAEFVMRGYAEGAVPYSARKTLATIEAFVESEISSFRPDIVVYGPVELVVGYVMHERAQARGIPSLGLQPSFMAEHFICHSYGYDWQEHLRALAEGQVTTNIGQKHEPSGATSRPPDRKAGLWDISRWTRAAERVLRLLPGGASFDTAPGFAASIYRAVAPGRWLPGLPVVHSVESFQRPCVLVALHQPVVAWTRPTWIDLIEFALRATPEGTPLVIRPHPTEVARRLPPDLDEALRSRNVHVSRIGQGPSLAALLGRCRALLTLTSAVGMEALRAGIPVFVLGPAFYSGPGMAAAVTPSDADEVRQALAQPPLVRPDARAVESLIAGIVRDFAVPSVVGPSTEGDLPDRIRRMLQAPRAA